MTDIVKKDNPAILKPVTEKFRSIRFEYDQKVCPDIFDFVLTFGIELKQEKKLSGGAESVISTMKEATTKMVFRSYRVPA
jgi:hypothetical protein